MKPDFNQKAVETIAKRAAYRCSNPDCGAPTVGPNSNPEKSTTIGEAAHIYGARPASKRYNAEMTDESRSSITNAIWLCRNCHKEIDSDETRYTSDLLFHWRQKHEESVIAELGNKSDRIRLAQQEAELKEFSEYPPLVKRIVIDKPDAWEYRLAAELLRHSIKPHLRRVKDLRNGVYVGKIVPLEDFQVLGWVSDKLNEGARFVEPLEGLMDGLTKSFGKTGEPGDVEEILHICKLIERNLAQITEFEEEVYSVSVPDEYTGVVTLLRDLLGQQLEKLADIPVWLDEIVALNEVPKDEEGSSSSKPRVVTKMITFELPSDWQKKMQKEFKKIERSNSEREKKDGVGGFSSLLLFIVIVFFFLAIF